MANASSNPPDLNQPPLNKGSPLRRARKRAVFAEHYDASEAVIASLQASISNYCVNCDFHLERHLDGKCLFAPTHFKAAEP